MRVLIVFAHPVRKSFNRAILEATKKGLTDAGHEVKIADLHAEKFQSAMTEADFAQFENQPMPEDVLREQARIEWSDAMVFIFPLWWWSIPGILKGWIDRVMSYGWAWLDPSDPDSGNLKSRKILVLTTAGASAGQLSKRGYDAAFHTQLNIGTWDYCGFKDVTTKIFHGVHHETPEALRNSYLEEAYSVANKWL